MVFQSFFCIQLFPTFFIVQVFRAPGLSGSRSRVVVQTLGSGFEGSSSGLQPYLKESQRQVFLVNIAKFLATPTLKNICNSCFWTRNSKRFNNHNNFPNLCIILKVSIHLEAYLEVSQISVMELLPNNSSWKSTVLEQSKTFFIAKSFSSP